MVLDSVGYIVQDLFGKGFKKLVPLAKDSNTPNVNSGGVIAIADDPNYWNPTKLADNYHRFHHIATTFGPMILSDGTVGHNHCLDVDGDSVRAALEPYLPELMKLTYIVVTRKGLHVHWIEHTQHERIGNATAGRYVRRCMPDFPFEIKTDHKGGLAHLPPSLHRKDIKDKVPNPFRYHKLEGCADKVGVIDNFMDSGLGLYDFLLQPQILGQHIREPTGVKKEAVPNGPLSRIRESEGVPEIEQSQGDGGASDNTMMSEVEEEEESSEIGTPSPHLVVEEEFIADNAPPPTPSNLHFICADRIYNLVDDWYVKDHRNNAMLCITGAIRRSWSDIAYEDAEAIIKEFCKTAGDEELTTRLATLKSTYEKDDANQNAGFGPFYDILVKLKPNMSTDEQNQKIKQIRMGVYAALDDFKADSILERYPNLEISKSAHRHIVIFEHTIEEVEFPQDYNSILKETVRSVQRKALLLNAAPVAPIEEFWDPIYSVTKYKMTFRHLVKGNMIHTRSLEKALTTDELEEWLRANGTYYHKAGKLGEVIHAVIDTYTKAGLVNHKIGTDIEGLVFLPDEKGRQVLVLSNMERPPEPTQKQAIACIGVMRQSQKKFYSSSELETARHAHFTKIGVVAPIDFPRRQSGAVNEFDIIPRQDLGGWTDSGKTKGYAAIPLRMYRLPLNKGVGQHSYIVGAGSVDTPARFIEQTRWTTFPIILDEADRYSEWEEDREARRILSIFKNSTQITNPRDTLTSDSEQITKPSAAFVMLTHNSSLIQEDGFNKRCIGHEFTIKDEKTLAQMEAFNEFWGKNGHTFGYLGDFIINYYLNHREVLNNKWLDIAKKILHAFYVDKAGLSEQVFQDEWDQWLGKIVESDTSKAGLVEARTANVISMFRQMINDAWIKNRQQAALWIAINKRNKLKAGEFDYSINADRVAMDEVVTGATFAEKFEALVMIGALPHLVWHEKNQVLTMDSSIVDEMKQRWRISRVSHQSLANLLKINHGLMRFSDGSVKRVAYASLAQFVDRVAPKGVEV